MIIAFYKPFGVLSQFTSNGSPHTALSAFDFPSNVYPVGRLDADSEGLLLLSDESSLVKFLLEPKYAHPREYWVQVEGSIHAAALQQLSSGVTIQQYRTQPCQANVLTDDNVRLLPPRMPPIRVRQTIPTSWISLELTEGKNRQVRKMTAAVGFPTLRLIRVRIGNFRLSSFDVGVWRKLTSRECRQVMMR